MKRPDFELVLAVFIYLFYSLRGKPDRVCVVQSVLGASSSIKIKERRPSSLSSLHKRAKLRMILLQSCAPSVWSFQTRSLPNILSSALWEDYLKFVTPPCINITFLSDCCKRRRCARNEGAAEADFDFLMSWSERFKLILSFAREKKNFCIWYCWLN